MARALLLSVLVVVVPVVLSESDGTVEHWCETSFSVESVLWPGQCAAPPCSTTKLSPAGMSLPALLSFNATQPFEAVLTLLNTVGGICGGVLITHHNNGSGRLLGVPCDTRVQAFFLPWSGRRVEGHQWWHLGLAVHSQTVTLSPLTLDNTTTYTITNHHCRPALLLATLLSGPKQIGYSALTAATNSTSAAATNTAGIVGVVVAAITVSGAMSVLQNSGYH